MKKIIIVIILIGLVAVGVWLAMKNPKTSTYKQPEPVSNNASTSPMKIESPVFINNQTIPTKYTCEQEGVNPPLKFSNVPAEAKSLALIVDDPDAPGGDWVHWLVWNINPSTLEIAEHSVPREATEGTTSFGSTGFGAPCPPPGSGAHHYRFYLYALDTKLNLPTRTTKEDLEKAMNGIVIDQAELVGIYQR